VVCGLFLFLTGCEVQPASDGAYHVRPGQDIQRALDLASADPAVKTVRVHAGTYRPRRSGQAMVWFNARHDGITLEAVGEVILTAANTEIADPAAPSFPAVVNHVVYFGDGISRSTILRGFRITGANNYVTRDTEPVDIQPDAEDMRWEKGMFFYTDGGGIKIFGRSYPRIEGVEIYGNYASPCAGGVSIEHRGFDQDAVLLRDCIFRENRSQVTGAALDLLPGSAAELHNCLFVGNIANIGIDYVGRRGGLEYNQEHGSGALTVFPGSRVHVERCTFTANWNGVDDKGDSRYERSVFWRNVATGGISPGRRYELDLAKGDGVAGCVIAGDIEDLRGTIDRRTNTFDATDPDFDENYVPRAPGYTGVGYRPPAAGR
jgi:hypothetical protein